MQTSRSGLDQAPAELRLRSGPLASAGGFAIYSGLPDSNTMEWLRYEAQANFSQATRQVSYNRDDTEYRGGIPARALMNGPGGEAQDQLYQSIWLGQALSDICGVTVKPTGNRGSYSYYTEPGDFLDTHLDVQQCDVTLITVLHDDTSAEDPGGGLAIYSDQIDQPLSRVRALSDRTGCYCKVQPGQSVVLLGGLVPHRVVPLSGTGQRVISALCFQAH